MSNPSWQKTRLSGIQIKQLCMMAGQAFKIAKLRSDPRTEDGVDAYRKAGQKEAAQIDSLTQAHQGHYLALKGYWFTVIGNLEAAFYAFLAAGDQNEHRRQMAWRLMGQVEPLAAGIRAEKARIQIDIDEAQAAKEAWLYTQHLANDKFDGRRIESLNATELEQLGFTVTNRANAKLKLGKTANRNKKQTRVKLGLETRSEAPLEEPSRMPTNHWIGADVERTHAHEDTPL
jgi:hypothetical protein